ncbi:MAG: hypothetical protein GY853_01535 [PVC group bacterium]|nr:hypothetical protein [PVC group bacterium]
MIYDFPRIFNDYDVQYSGPNSRGYYEVQCPFPNCGSSSGKKIGAIHPEKFGFFCFKCHYHPLNEAMLHLVGENWLDVHLNYKLELNVRDHLLKQHKPREAARTSLILPKGQEEPLNKKAFQYLYGRGFDPNRLIEKYKVYSTGHLGDYKFRIIIPIYFKNKLVSFQGRGYTDQTDLRYKSCSKKDEVVHYKNIVYGIDSVPGDHCIVVEGIFDKWRLGDHSVCTFGISYTDRQVLLLANRFKKVTILFDTEKQAKAQAFRLGSELSGLGVGVNIISLDGVEDPGDFSQLEADRFVKKIFRGSV